MICTFEQRFSIDGHGECGEHVSAARNGSPVLAGEREAGDLREELLEGTSA